MKVLVTGGAGMIGSTLVKELIKNNHNVFVADNFWRGQINYLRSQATGLLVVPNENIFNVDLRDSQKCIELIKGYDLVYHLADIVAGINYVFDNQLFLWRSNILINSNVINAFIIASRILFMLVLHVVIQKQCNHI